MSFKGFNPDIVKYLHNVYTKNSKVWYDKHKGNYQKLVRDPFYEFIGELAPQMTEIDPEIITQPNRCLSRIYKDARFSKDGFLYRNRVWLTFKRPAEDWLIIPAFFFEITEEKCTYGMGYYFATAATMADFRSFILDSPRAFKKAIKPIEDDEFLRIDGDKYKKPKPDAQKGMEDWFTMKNFYVAAERPLELTFSPDILHEVSNAFDKLKELYKILTFDLPEIRKRKEEPGLFLP